MKMNKQIGISLIALIITIVVIILLIGIIAQKGIQRVEQAQVAKHNTNISTIEEEVESFYYYKGGDLPVVDLTIYQINPGSTLEAEIIKNDQQNDMFYVLDMSKLGKVIGKEGNGVGDDIYIVSVQKHNVYYVRGTNIRGLTYHGLMKSSNNYGPLASSVSSSPSEPPTLSSTPVLSAIPTLSPLPTHSPTPTNSPTLTPIPGSGYFDGTVNSPKISTGMTPVSWNGSGWINLTTTEQLNFNNEWYDYSNTGGTANKWANIRLKDNSLLVWIPRYTYQIASGEHSATTGTINIRFSNGTTDDTSEGYRIHPAFYWGGWNIPVSAAMSKQGGGIELTGIWVGKFEPNNTGGKIKIAANNITWVNITINNIFTTCRAMQTTNSATYGISTDTNAIDTHLIKNSEWGAVAYLSKYARGSTEITVNTSSNITASSNIVNNKSQSTTGNEYGIYDMSGCVYEYVASYTNNGHANLTSNGNSLVTASAQYKDVFPKAATESQASNYNAASLAYGYALYETSSGASVGSSWFGDYSVMPFTTCPFFLRGGDNGGGANSGVFAFSNTLGGTGSNFGFRVSICVI